MTSPSIMSLDEFKQSNLGRLAKGKWIIKYHDSSHLPENSFVSIGDIDIEEIDSSNQAFFSFELFPLTNIVGDESSDSTVPTNDSVWGIWNSNKQTNEKYKGASYKEGKLAANIIVDQINHSMTRLGLLTPVFDINPELGNLKHKHIVVVFDTSAIRTGVVRHLKEQYNESTQIWGVIPTVALMEIGEKQAWANNAAKIEKFSNYGLIRARPQITIAPQEIKWIKANLPTESMDLSPELLRTFRGFETNKDKEPERVSINDRLILEGIKHMRRERNLSNVYLLSGDLDMSRLASLDGIGVIYPIMPKMPDNSRIYSIRYSIDMKKYVICSLQRFLWDLTHIFSNIRISCVSGPDEGREIELFYYYLPRTVNDWYDDKLEVTAIGSSSINPSI